MNPVVQAFLSALAPAGGQRLDLCVGKDSFAVGVRAAVLLDTAGPAHPAQPRLHLQPQGSWHCGLSQPGADGEMIPHYARWHVIPFAILWICLMKSFSSNHSNSAADSYGCYWERRGFRESQFRNNGGTEHCAEIIWFVDCYVYLDAEMPARQLTFCADRLGEKEAGWCSIAASLQLPTWLPHASGRGF